MFVLVFGSPAMNDETTLSLLISLYNIISLFPAADSLSLMAAGRTQETLTNLCSLVSVPSIAGDWLVFEKCFTGLIMILMTFSFAGLVFY